MSFLAELAITSTFDVFSYISHDFMQILRKRGRHGQAESSTLLISAKDFRWKMAEL